MIHKRLKTIREHTGLSQKAFGEKINLSQTHMASLENGKRSLTVRVAQDICRIFHINESWLIRGEGIMYADILNDISPDTEIQRLVIDYVSLSDRDKALVRGIIDSFMEKIKS